jgi:hypothetical protein
VAAEIDGARDLRERLNASRARHRTGDRVVAAARSDFFRVTASTAITRIWDQEFSLEPAFCDARAVVEYTPVVRRRNYRLESVLIRDAGAVEDATGR